LKRLEAAVVVRHEAFEEMMGRGKKKGDKKEEGKGEKKEEKKEASLI